MSNLIYDLNKDLDLSIINLGNPSLINNNNYFSKISQGPMNKNFYIQLPKCLTKQGFVKNSTKNYCELNFQMCENNVIKFFENLEKLCIEKIHSNKELWFYESENINKDDIEDLMTTVLKPYKHGKNFLIKTHIKLDKFNIYDENENIIPLDEYNNSHEFIPLVNINGIKFSSKNFTIELILSQIMVVYPADEFEKQILIKFDKKNEHSNIIKNVIEEKKVEKEDVEEKKVEKEDVEEKKVKEKKVEKEDVEEEDVEVNKVEEKKVEEKKVEEEDVEEKKVEKEDVEEKKVKEKKVEEEDVEEKKVKEKKVEEEEVEKEDVEKKNVAEEDVEKKNVAEFTYLINSDLEKVDFDVKEIDENKNSSITLKSHEEIYLEIYKKAKQKAKDIRKNAIDAFLEAKNIKNKYRLDELDLSSDSSDDEELFNMS